MKGHCLELLYSYFLQGKHFRVPQILPGKSNECSCITTWRIDHAVGIQAIVRQNRLNSPAKFANERSGPHKEAEPHLASSKCGSPAVINRHPSAPYLPLKHCESQLLTLEIWIYLPSDMR